ncbi:MAG TPA: hypothetical protein PLQ36_03075 [Candidatus Gracilibacteria bacterium]|nr:hypothetical protein [Candidatus Gracilibacteria bacterium]
MLKLNENYPSWEESKQGEIKHNADYYRNLGETKPSITSIYAKIYQDLQAVLENPDYLKFMQGIIYNLTVKINTKLIKFFNEKGEIDTQKEGYTLQALALFREIEDYREQKVRDYQEKYPNIDLRQNINDAIQRIYTYYGATDAVLFENRD